MGVLQHHRGSPGRGLQGEHPRGLLAQGPFPVLLQGHQRGHTRVPRQHVYSRRLPDRLQPTRSLRRCRQGSDPNKRGQLPGQWLCLLHPEAIPLPTISLGCKQSGVCAQLSNPLLQAHSPHRLPGSLPIHKGEQPGDHQPLCSDSSRRHVHCPPSVQRDHRHIGRCPVLCCKYSHQRPKAGGG